MARDSRRSRPAVRPQLWSLYRPTRLAALRKALALSISVWREDETEASVLRRCGFTLAALPAPASP